MNLTYGYSEFQTTWNMLFGAVAPLMMHEVPDEAVKKAADQFVSEANQERLRVELELEEGAPISCSLHGMDFQTIKVQFRALGLIAKDWTLTPYGEEMMTRLRAVKRATVLNMAHTRISMCREFQRPLVIPFWPSCRIWQRPEGGLRTLLSMGRLLIFRRVI